MTICILYDRCAEESSSFSSVAYFFVDVLAEAQSRQGQQDPEKMDGWKDE
jgi:hypothetical protein